MDIKEIFMKQQMKKNIVDENTVKTNILKDKRRKDLCNMET